MRHFSSSPRSTGSQITGEHWFEPISLRQQVCHLVAEVRLERSNQAPSLARDFVRRHLCATHATPACPVSELVASEIVTLAVCEGDGPVTLAIGCETTGVLLTVTCGSPQGAGSWVESPRDRLPLLVARSMADDCGRTSSGADDTLWYVVPTGYRWNARLS
ncbi:MAG: hypothetical protein ACXVW2_03830 [Nocardioidaceae bacterium]